MRAVQIFLALLPAAALALGLVARLPDRIAIHWGFFGQPDSAAPRGVAFAVAVLAITVASLYALVRSRAEAKETGPTELVSVSFVATLLTGVWAGICMANHGASSWQQATLSLWASVAFVAAACVVAWAVGHLIRRPSPALGTKASVGLCDGQRGVFFSQMVSPLMTATAFALLAAGVLILMNASWGSALALFGVSVLLMTFSTVSLSIDRTGVHIAYGPLSFPRQTISLQDVVSAEAIDVRPLAYGGWGYRGSLRFMGKAALVLRAGDGIELSLRGAKTFVVTVDDAASAAGLVNDLVRLETA